jgi:hypothetical protein
MNATGCPPKLTPNLPERLCECGLCSARKTASELREKSEVWRTPKELQFERGAARTIHATLDFVKDSTVLKRELREIFGCRSRLAKTYREAASFCSCSIALNTSSSSAMCVFNPSGSMNGFGPPCANFGYFSSRW